MLVLRIVVFHRRADRKAFALGDVQEMVRHRFENLLVDESLVAQGAEIFRDVEQRRVRRAIRQWRQRGIDDLDAELDGFEATERAQAGGAVRVQFHRYALGIRKHDRHQGLHPLRGEQAARVFQAQAIDFERRGLARAFGKIFVGVFWRYGIDNVQHRIDADVAGDFGLPLPAFELVPLLGNARFADAVGGHSLHEQAVHRARRDVEGAESPRVQTQRRARDALAHELDPRPGIFLELAHAFFQMRARDQLDGVEAGAIHGFGDGKHHARGHTLGPQALVAVANGRVDETNTVSGHGS